MCSTCSAATSAAVTELFSRAEAGPPLDSVGSFTLLSQVQEKKMCGEEADAMLHKVLELRVSEARSDSMHTRCFSPRRPAGSENCAALPSSACLIAEVRRVNIIHISQGWSTDGRKLQELSRGIEEAESDGSKRKQMEEVQRKAASSRNTAASEMSPYCHSRGGCSHFPTGTKKHDI